MNFSPKNRVPSMGGIGWMTTWSTPASTQASMRSQTSGDVPGQVRSQDIVDGRRDGEPVLALVGVHLRPLEGLVLALVGKADGGDGDLEGRVLASLPHPRDQVGD